MDEDAPAFKGVRTHLLYPYRQKELVARVKKLLGDSVINGHDILCVRKAYRVETEPNFFYKPQYSSPQYSEAFAQWLTDHYRADQEFFEKARELCKRDAP